MTGTRGVRDVVACGCGEENLPWLLARFGAWGAALLVLGFLFLLVALTALTWVVVRLTRGRGEREAPDAGLGILDRSEE
ncbi:hypothetical protein V2W30_16730 [Streptomyces sp. Q6]|uniref:Uncharacterized protein n=1 Tax=Streptomyces citrinus TaxID=3118173 RepID=A0ACD5AG48_9ACTN